MKCDKYMGMDVHQATTVVDVVDADGKSVLETIVATEAAAIIRLVQSLSGPLHVTFEETTQAAWLYEVVRAYVTEVVVCDPRRNKLLGEGSKADKPDARKLAELLRAGMLRSVYHGHEATRKLKELVRAYETLSIDTERTMVRIKAVYRGRGIPTPGRGVYQLRKRDQWLEKLSEPGARQRVAFLYEELDLVRSLRRRGETGDAGREPGSSGGQPVENHSATGTHSMCTDCRHRRHAASIPDEASVLELQRPGGGDAYEFGI